MNFTGCMLTLISDFTMIDRYVLWNVIDARTEKPYLEASINNYELSAIEHAAGVLQSSMLAGEFMYTDMRESIPTYSAAFEVDWLSHLFSYVVHSNGDTKHGYSFDKINDARLFKHVNVHFDNKWKVAGILKSDWIVLKIFWKVNYFI